VILDSQEAKLIFAEERAFVVYIDSDLARFRLNCPHLLALIDKADSTCRLSPLLTGIPVALAAVSMMLREALVQCKDRLEAPEHDQSDGSLQACLIPCITMSVPPDRGPQLVGGSNTEPNQ